jgi:hypothetical protein
MDLWDILWPFGYILCIFWYIFFSSGLLYAEKSGNPALNKRYWDCSETIETGPLKELLRRIFGMLFFSSFFYNFVLKNAIFWELF